MLTSHAKLLQTKLKSMGFYAGKIDGERGPMTNAALRKAFPTMPGPMPPGWQGWSDKRVAIGFLQLWARAEGIEPGPVDGWWGPQTDFAATALIEKQKSGTVVPWRADSGRPRNPHGWPKESGVTAFFGPHGAADWSRPPPRLVKVPSPYPLRIAWNLRETRTFLWAHEKTADSVATVLHRIHAHYGDADIRRLRIDVFSGDYFPRKKKGSATQWSMHSWGIAYDFDDTNNQLRWGADRAWFARPDYRDFWNIWEDEGWVSLGRARNFDWMHVQAAHLD